MKNKNIYEGRINLYSGGNPSVLSRDFLLRKRIETGENFINLLMETLRTVTTLTNLPPLKIICKNCAYMRAKTLLITFT